MMKLIAALVLALPALSFAAEKPYALYHDFSLPYHQGRSMVWVVQDGPAGLTAWVTVILQVNHGPNGSLIVYSKDLERVALPNRSHPILDWVEEAGGVKKNSVAVCADGKGGEVRGEVTGVYVNPMRNVYQLKTGGSYRFFADCRPY